MSHGLSGLTQYIYNYEQERLERIQQAKKEAFINYVIGFGKRALKIQITCPECGNKTMIATESYTNKTGKDVLFQNIPATKENLKTAVCISRWKCSNCRHEKQTMVTFEELREDFNKPKFRKWFSLLLRPRVWYYMTNHGILLIDWKNGIDNNEILKIINSFYSSNTSVIEGMAYYETEDENLIRKVQDLLEDKKQ